MNETIFVQEFSSSKSQRVQADENLIIINILGVNLAWSLELIKTN
jgi:hypothetical protein